MTPNSSEELQRELENILAERRISTLYQPIIDNQRGVIFGYEALTRGPSDSPLHAPSLLFDAANRSGQLLELEQLCWCNAYKGFIEQDLPGRLFLNASPPSLLSSEGLLGTEPPLDPQRVVIEVTEQYPIDDYAQLQQTLRRYRELGFALAIDDLGAGYAGLRLWSELRPDFVKLDSHFIQGLHKDPIKQEFVRSIRDIARGIHCKVVAEGIETGAEYAEVLRLGLDLGQGYHFARPKPRPARQLALRSSESSNEPTPLRYSESIGKLALEITPLSPQTSVAEVMERFRVEAELQTLPICEEGAPLGVVRRARLSNLMLAPYGRELHGRKPINHFMEQPLAVDHQQSLERVSQKLTDKLNFELEHDFIITREGRYLGLGKVRDLLRSITELQIRNARHANPLTQMPGNIAIEEQINRLLEHGGNFTVCYCDLDNFKPFNDHFGYRHGDEVIRSLANILSETVDTELDFIGHIGGDDFIIIFQSGDWQARCHEVLERFELRASGYYSEAQRRDGGFWGEDRNNQEVFLPLLSLSIGAITPDPERCRSHHEVAALASDAKKEAKRQDGNSLFIDRRRAPSPRTEPQALVASA